MAVDMPDQTDTRLLTLEELVAHQNAEIESLSDAVRQQWQEIDVLKKAVMRQRDRITELEEQGTGHDNTPPPHY